MSFAKDTLKSAGAGLVMTVSRFFSMAIIARQLGVEDFGILGFGIFCLDLIALFALAGLPGLTGLGAEDLEVREVEFIPPSPLWYGVGME